MLTLILMAEDAPNPIDYIPLIFVTALPGFYFVFRDNAAVYSQFTSAQKACLLLGLGCYVVGIFLFLFARILMHLDCID